MTVQNPREGQDQPQPEAGSGDATQALAPCHEPTDAPRREPQTNNTLTVDAGNGCKVVIDLRVTVEGGCGGASGAPSVSITDPPDPDDGGGGPDPELPRPLLRRDGDSRNAFVLWSKGANLPEVQSAWEPQFRCNAKSMSAFMTVEPGPFSSYYTGFGVSDLRFAQSATVTMGGKTPAKKPVTLVKAFRCEIKDHTATTAGGYMTLSFEVTHSPKDGLERAVVVMPARISKIGGSWTAYSAQGGYSKLDTLAEGSNDVELAGPIKVPEAGVPLYAFVVVSDIGLGEAGAIPFIDSPVYTIG
jgi:hypothetical protein